MAIGDSIKEISGEEWDEYCKYCEGCHQGYTHFDNKGNHRVGCKGRDSLGLKDGQPCPLKNGLITKKIS